MAEKFDFIQAYRDLDANVSRELIDARQKGHQVLLAEITSMSRVYDLCRLAFLLEPHPLPVTEWFEKPIRGLDPHFLVNKDKAEAGRIAALLLRDRIIESGLNIPLAVLSASFCGKRHSADGDVLTREANEALVAAVRNQRNFVDATPVSRPKFKDITAELNALTAQNPLQGNTTKAAVEAAVQASENAITTLAQGVETSLSSGRGDVVRLAEEVDMLWWYLSDWHELLDKRRSAAAPATRMLASGIELGGLVQQPPGPYGAYGILRKISDTRSDGKTTLRAALGTLSEDDARKLSKDILPSAKSLFPVHVAVQSVAERGPAGWESEFVSAILNVADVEISHFDLGIQAYRESVLLNYVD